MDDLMEKQSLALAPARDGVVLPCNRKKPRPYPNALVLLNPASESEDGAIGRHELRLAHWQTCPCDRRKQTPKSSSSSSLGSSDHRDPTDSQPTSGSSSQFCSRCDYPWTKHLGKNFIRMELIKNDPRHLGLWIKLHNGTYPLLDEMSINGKLLRDYSVKAANDNQHRQDNLSFWLGPIWLQLGDFISFLPISERDGDTPMEFRVVMQQGGRLVTKCKQDTATRHDESRNESQSLDDHSQQSTSDVESPLKTQQSCEIHTQPESGSRFRHFLESSQSQDESQQSCVVDRSSLPLITPPAQTNHATKVSGRDKPSPAATANVDSSAGEAKVKGYERASKQSSMTDDRKRENGPGRGFIAGTAWNIVTSRKAATVMKPAPKSSSNASSVPKLYFVKSNRHGDMFNKKLREMAKRKATARGASVMETFCREAPPTHFIVGNALRMDEGDLLNKDLKFHSVPELQCYADEHQIAFVRLKWVMRGGETVALGPLAEDEVYHLAQHGTSVDEQQASPRKRQRDDVDDSQILENKNKELAELFEQLATIYREAPTKDEDVWRAYTFNRAASVMRHLSFDITIESVDELKRLRGFSDKCVAIAKEYMFTGRCSRLQGLLSDKERTSIRTFTGIWAVGPKRAAELYRQGYRSLSDLRNATQVGNLRWYRNEYIGLKYYEDINEEMSRDEAKEIVDIVTAVATGLDFYPSAQVQAMGSYRRMKATCGDVDFIITDPAWMDEVPPTFLGKLVDKLCSDGFVLHHLTFVKGMAHESFETLDESDLTHIKPSDERQAVKRDKRSYTWFGIFHSPVHAGKVRRVDIKVYPYSDHIYAALYFTGNGHFNRAMRFWSKKKKARPHYHLDDHGLWMLNDNGALLRDSAGHHVRATEPDGGTFIPKTEKDVFDKLGIVWKEPHERDGFGALRSNSDEDHLVDVSMRDLLSDAAQYTWIK